MREIREPLVALARSHDLAVNTRRAGLAIVLIVLLGGIASGSSCRRQPVVASGLDERQERERPDVIVIWFDDLNDWLEPYGCDRVETPNFLRIASRGTTFTKAYCPSPSCSPSRTAILSGVAPHRSGVYVNAISSTVFLEDILTMPEAFRHAGYHVIGVGKAFHPERVEYWSEHYRPGTGQPTPDEAVVLSDRPKYETGRLHIEPTSMPDMALAKVSAHLLTTRSGDEPLFLSVGFHTPHKPWHLPAEFFERVPLADVALPDTCPDDLQDVPQIPRGWAGRHDDHESILEKGLWKHAVHAYGAAVAYSDALLGVVLDGLEASPRRDDTIVVIMSDHGYCLGEKEHWAKGVLWERACRVPFIVSLPGLEGPSRCEMPVSLIDLYPTLIELCDLGSPPHSLDGLSLVPLLRGKATSDHAARGVITTYQYGNHSVRSSRYRYTRYVDGSEELYDHEIDPLECENLAASTAHGAVVRRLARLLPRDNARPGPRFGPTELKDYWRATKPVERVMPDGLPVRRFTSSAHGRRPESR